MSKRLIVFLILTFSFILPSNAYAETVNEADFWSLIAAIADKLDNDLPITDQLDQLGSFDAVILENGNNVAIDTQPLVKQIEDAPDKVSQARIVDQLLEFRAVSPAQAQENGLIVLQAVLSRSEFADLHAESNTLMDRFLERLNEIFNEWFGQYSGIDSDVINTVQLIFGICFATLVTGIFVFWVRSIRRRFSAETSLTINSENAQYLDAQQTLSVAQEQAKLGDFREAIRYLYLSVLYSLDERDQLRFDRSKTNHEYLRQVAGTEWSSPLRAIVDVFDRVWYGFQPIDAATYTQYADQVKQLVNRPK